MPADSWDRFGALLRSYSIDPLTAKGGQDALSAMDEEENAIKLTKQKAEETKRSVFQKLLEKGIDNGADEQTLQKLASASGMDFSGMGLSGLGKPKLDPIEKRTEAAQKFGEKYSPESVDQWINTGQWSALKPISKTGKTSVVNPQSALVDEGGNVLYENKSVRPTRGGILKPKPANYTDAEGNSVLVDESDPIQVRKAIEGNWRKSSSSGVKDKIRNDVLSRNEALRKEIGGSTKLSDRYRLARAKIDENVASGLTGLPAGDKMKIELDKRRESLTRYDNSAERMMTLLEKDPTAATVGGDVARASASMAANAKGLLNLIPGADLTDVDLDESQWSDQLSKIAGDNAELRTTMFNLAMQMSIANTLSGQKLTNQMVQQALENIGASGRSPKAIKRKLFEVRKRVADSLDSALDGALEDYSQLDRPDPTTPNKDEAMAEARRRGLIK